MKKVLFLLSLLTIVLAGWRFLDRDMNDNTTERNPGEQREERSNFEKRRPRTLKETQQSPSKTKAVKPKTMPTDPWMKKRMAVIRATKKEQDNFVHLQEFSDSVATWKISQKYAAIHSKNFISGTPSVAKIGNHYIVETTDKSDNVVYNKKSGEMGVVRGSLMVNIRPGSDPENILQRLAQDTSIEVGPIFLHIGVIEVNARQGENIAEIANRLKSEDDIERVKIEIIQDKVRLW